jgi:hypothetical protein
MEGAQKGMNDQDAIMVQDLTKYYGDLLAVDRDGSISV